MSKGNMLPAEFYSRINRSRANSYSELLEKIATEPGIHLHYLGIRTKEVLDPILVDEFYAPGE